MLAIHGGRDHIAQCAMDDNRPADARGYRDLGKGSPTSSGSDHNISRCYQNHVSSLTHSCADRELNPRIGYRCVNAGQYADGDSAGKASATARRLHRSAQPTAVQRDTSAGESTANFFCIVPFTAGGFTWATECNAKG